MPLELVITVTDLDILGSTAVDEFVIPINNEENTNSTFSPPTIYFGTCGRNTAIVASIEVT